MARSYQLVCGMYLLLNMYGGKIKFGILWPTKTLILEGI